jgi:hypothetical protein
MRRILVSCAVLAVLALPAAATARAPGAARPGYLVVSKAVGDGGVHGAPVVTLIVKGFVLGRVSQEAKVQIVQLPSVGGEGAPQVVGADVSSTTIRYRGRFSGKEYRGSKFRFRAAPASISSPAGTGTSRCAAPASSSTPTAGTRWTAARGAPCRKVP